ncbi:hypothetical protein [Hydrogenovibrio thermophilus]|uniref:Uncharacterized protein n=1 Tax=Hydrogenovibrio thermophilus TaxID=265883 RepID=A0A410H5P2_9GAMM|nr:hypothetical protein [Hydrogenovibrio thermophilus]QAB16241.1 hypothetical protein EPV75_11495 [Hydrogenovibrio thermophilus]
MTGFSDCTSEVDQYIMGYQYDPEKEMRPIDIAVMYKKFEMVFGFCIADRTSNRLGNRIFEQIEEQVNKNKYDKKWLDESKIEGLAE